MCGVTGFLTTGTRNIGAKDRGTYLRQTLMVDSLRGFHSTGVFYTMLGDEVAGAGWAKACQHGIDFVDSKEYKEIEAKIDNLRFAVGHNRWATTGAADAINNAHPFQEDSITLVHNGTLDFDGGLITPQELLGVEVDSHAICHNLAIHDAKEVISKLDGAFTLIWHDDRDDSLNFCRNSERPLTMWVPEQDYLDTLYFGSEHKMMDWIMTRNHIGTRTGNFIELPIGQIWKYLPDTLVPEITKVDLAPTMSYWNNRQYYQGNSGGNYGKKYQQSGGQGNSTTPTTAGGAKPSTQKFGVSNVVNKWLNREGFDRTDSLPFLPLTSVGHTIVGNIECLDTAAIVVGLANTSVKSQWNTRWTVRPVGLRYVTNKETLVEEVVIVAALRSFHYHDTMFRYGDGWLANEEDKAKTVAVVPKEEVAEECLPFDVDAMVEHDVSSTFPLGMNRKGTRQEWYEMTASGCGMCDVLPQLHTADCLVWLNDGYNSYLCASCADSNHVT
jgi:hypothetical protein